MSSSHLAGDAPETVTVSNPTVIGAITVSNFPGIQSVSVSNFPATQDVSITKITGAAIATKFAIASASIPAATSVLLIPANANRKGFSIYNNSTNSLYICIENPAVAANLVDFCGSNAGPTSVVRWLGPVVYTGAIYGIRNAGTGGVTAWEFT